MSNNYLSSNTVQVRIVHQDNGIPTHQMILDYVNVNYGGGGGTGFITASAIENIPNGNIAGTNVQAAINELDSEKEPLLTKGNLTENATGLEFSSTRQVIGGNTTLTLTTGYIIPTTASVTTYDNHITNDGDLSATNEIQAPTISGDNIGLTQTTTTISISGKEDKSNKVTSLSGSSTDVQYPSAKLTYEQLALKQPQLNGTGFVRASGTTISYDNSSYLNLNGGSMNNTNLVTNMNADLLDGYHSSAFSQSNHGHTVIATKGTIQAETGRAVYDYGIYCYNVNNGSLGDSTPSTYWSVSSWGNGLGGSAQLAASWTSGGNELYYRSLRDYQENWNTWKKIWHEGNLTNPVTANASSFTANRLIKATGTGDEVQETGITVDAANNLTAPSATLTTGAFAGSILGGDAGGNIGHKTVNQAIGGDGLIQNYAIKFDGTKLTNSQIFDDDTNIGFRTNTPDSYGYGGNRKFISFVNNTTNGESFFQLISNGTGNSLIDFGNNLIRRATIIGFDGSDLGFFTNPTNSGINMSERMRILSNGNVKINNLSGTGTRLTTTSSDGTLGAITNGSEGQVMTMVSGVPVFAAPATTTTPTLFTTISISDETTTLTTGTSKMTFRMPIACTMTSVRASCITAPTGSTLIFDINENGASILSTKLSIDASEKTSTTAASQAVISDSSIADDSEMTIDIDQVGSTIAGAGAKIIIYYTKN